MHCYFILAGDANIPILFNVERVREGRSFLTRTVQARQRGKCIFTTTISFVAEGSGGKESLQHGWDMPEDAKERLERVLQEEKAANQKDCSDGTPFTEKADNWPFTAKRLGIANSEHIQQRNPRLLCKRELTSSVLIDTSRLPQTRQPQTWLRCNGRIQGNIRHHICALAYMSDSYFIGAVSRVHRVDRFSFHANSSSPFLRELAQEELKERASSDDSSGDDKHFKSSPNTPAQQPPGRIGMMVSLDHAIYFHRPGDVKADDWIFTEMESPWSGEGRGMVTQKMWNQDGRLLASCVQEVSQAP